MEWMGPAFAALVVAAVVYAVAWASGRRAGIKEGFYKYAQQLKFERREQTMIDPLDQPHAAKRPRSSSRVSDAHMSQPRRYWNE